MSLTLRVQRGDPQGIAQDPDQSVSNAGDGFLDKGLTTRNALSLGVGAVYIKRVASATGGALINQMGNARVERNVNLLKKGSSYLLIGAATGNVALVAASIVADGLVSTVSAVESNAEIRYTNERKASERGGTTSLGNNYD